jgi:hypothetical protein
VYALVLENDGSALAAAITCAGLALADASVPMYDLVVAATLVCRARVYLTYLSLTERNVVSNPILCVCVCVCARARMHTHTHHIQVHILNDSLLKTW